MEYIVYDACAQGLCPRVVCTCGYAQVYLLQTACPACGALTAMVCILQTSN